LTAEWKEDEVFQQLSSKLLFTLSLLIGFTVMLVLAFSFGARARLLPLIIGFPVVTLLVIQLLFDLFPSLMKVFDKSSQVKTQKTPHELAVMEGTLAEAEIEEGESGVPLGIAFLWAFSLYLGYNYLGYLVTVPLVLLLYLKLQLKESWKFSLALSSGTGIFVYLVFYLSIGLKTS